MGTAAFGVICRDERFAQVPKILETAKEEAPDGRPWDAVNLEILRQLAAGKTVQITPLAAPEVKKEAGVTKPPRRQGTKKK